MAKKTKRFKKGGSGSVPLQNLDYNLVSGSGRGGNSRGLQLRPVVMRQPSSDLSKLTGTSPPKGVGIQGRLRFKKGGKVSASEAVHKHERAKHKGQPLTKMAKGGSVSASRRGDGIARKGKTKGRFV